MENIISDSINIATAGSLVWFEHSNIAISIDVLFENLHAWIANSNAELNKLAEHSLRPIANYIEYYDTV